MAYLWEPVIVFAVYEQHPAEVFLIIFWVPWKVLGATLSLKVFVLGLQRM
jgi:hypothetical protein